MLYYLLNHLNSVIYLLDEATVERASALLQDKSKHLY